MKTLVLSQRFTDDSNALWRAALAAGWDVVRLHGFRVEEVPEEAAIYGETLFADAVAESLGVSVLGPPDDWLPALPRHYLQRDLRLTDLEGAKGATFPAFIKPPDEKFFAARVYEEKRKAHDSHRRPQRRRSPRPVTPSLDLALRPQRQRWSPPRDSPVSNTAARRTARSSAGGRSCRRACGGSAPPSRGGGPRKAP